jgi:pilus assembly protein CpaE
MLLDEIDDLELGEIVESSTDVVDVLTRRNCHVLVVDEAAGPVPALDVVREVQGRMPHIGVLVLASGGNSLQLEATVDAGARGVIDLEESFDDVRRRLVAAGDWSVKIRGIKSSTDGMASTGCHLITVTGAKGGVGTTTIAVHLARSIRATLPVAARLCVVDLDLAKADLPAYLNVVPRRDLSDLTSLGDLIVTQSVQDVVFPVSAGFDVLCGPAEPERGEDVTAATVRSLVIALRQAYDVVIIDAGSSLTETMVTALELSDEVVVVATPDVPAIRGVKRLVDACERLGVRDAGDLRLLLNQSNGRDDLQPKTVARMAQIPLARMAVPAVFRKLEPAANMRDPARVQDRSFLSAIASAANELLETWQQVSAPPTDLETEVPSPRFSIARRRQLRERVAADDGVLSIEFMALMPFVLLILALCLQVVTYGAASYQASRAAGAAAHAAARGADPQAAARSEISTSFFGRVSVGSAHNGPDGTVSVSVSVDVPQVAPLPWTGDLVAKATGGSVREP